MISLKELQYVNEWARKAPYPGEKYAKETLESMCLLLEKYNKYYKNKDYSIIFSDSTEINFEILDLNICHMLGVDHKNLIGGCYNEFLEEVLGFSPSETITSYDLINRVINNYEDVVKYDETANYRALNYYKSRIKCAIFEKMSEFEKFNFGKLDCSNDSKILFTPSNEAIAPYFLIRLSKNENEIKYVVSSLMAPEQNVLHDFFDHKCAIPTQMIIDDNRNLSKLETLPGQKIALLNLYKSIVLDYSFENKMDISGDYLSNLAELDKNQKRKIR